MKNPELYKTRSRTFFDQAAHTKYGNSPYLDDAILSETIFDDSDVILDLGCGQGRFLEKIRSIHPTIPCYGIDLSPEMIRIATGKALENCRISLGDGDSLPYDDDYFSKIFCMNAFHHFPDPEKTVRELARVVKDEGEVVIGDVWLPPLLRGAVNAFLPYTKTGDYRIYSKKEIVALFGRYAFDLTKYFCVYPFLFVAKFRRSID